MEPCYKMVSAYSASGSYLSLVQHLDVPSDDQNLAEPTAVVRQDEPTVQLVALGLLVALHHPSVPDYGGVIQDDIAGPPRYVYHRQVTLHVAGGLVPSDHDDSIT